jgi:hypothetical protein
VERAGMRASARTIAPSRRYRPLNEHC